MAAGVSVDSKANYPDVKNWYRIVFAGDPGIGKTSLVLRFARGEFHDPPPTILGEANCFLKVVTLEDNVKVGMELWDTAGMERHHSVTDHYYRNSNAVIFCYDVTDNSTFKDIKNWAKEVNTRLGPVYDKVSKFLVGTKLDLFESAPETERVDKDSGMKKAIEQKPSWPFLETSSKDNTNVDTLFTEVARALASQVSHPRRDTIKIDAGPTKAEQDSSGCCKKN
jgi:small GTP-binding protein